MSIKFVKSLLNGRPEEFQVFLARFQTEAPRMGRGRVFFNLTRFRKYIESKSGLGVKWKAKMMDREQYFEWAKTVEGGSKSTHETVEQWQTWLATSDPKVVKDKGGRNGGPRVAVHVEDIVYGYNELATGQSLTQEADIKDPTQDKIAELEKEAASGCHGVRGFASSTFAGTGIGAMGAAMASRPGIENAGMIPGMGTADSSGDPMSMTGLCQEFGFKPPEPKKRKTKQAGDADEIADEKKEEGSGDKGGKDKDKKNFRQTRHRQKRTCLRWY